MQMSAYFYTSLILIKCNEILKHLMYCERRMSWLLLLFDKTFSNNFQISSKFGNIMLSFYKISLKKYNMQMKMVKCSFFITNFYYIFSSVKWSRETRHLQTKISTCQFSNKKHLLQCKVKYNDETIKIKDD